jgi:hypothetical protein
MFRDYPILGVGPGDYPLHYLEYSQEIGLDPRLAPRDAHSLYLEALAETGIIGASAFLVVLWLALRGAWRARLRLAGRDALLAEGIFVALVSYLVAGLFLHAAYPRYLWIVVGFGFVAGNLARGEVRDRGFGMRSARGAPRASAKPALGKPLDESAGERSGRLRPSATDEVRPVGFESIIASRPLAGERFAPQPRAVNGAAHRAAGGARRCDRG